MKIITETNYLGGILSISIDSEAKTTDGVLFVPDESSPESVVEFRAVTKCAEPDEFKELKGVKIVKLKLAQKYHRYQKVKNHEYMQFYLDQYNQFKSQYDKHCKKLKHIEDSLMPEFEEPKKPAKKTATKTTESKKKSK